MIDKAEGQLSFRDLSKRCSKIFLSKYSYLLFFCAACVISATGWEVYGALVFAGVICLTLVFCDDIMASALPLLLLCVFVTTCYDSADTFLKFVWVAVPAVGSVIFHFVYYRQKFVIGKSFWGLLAVSIAITLSGVGVIPASDYFSAASLYYIVFLGFGMVGLYLLLKSQLCAERDYDVKEKGISILYIMGLCAVFVVLFHVIPLIDFNDGFKRTGDLQASNNLSTVLMFALPCPFYYATKNKLHILSAVLMAAAMMISGSRAGLIFAMAELVLCFIIAALFDKKNRIFYICVLGGAAVTAAVVCIFFRQEMKDAFDKMGLYPVIEDDEARIKLIDRAFELFKKYPVTGHGLTYRGNFDIYSPKKGAMGWYHMMIPQVVASMGCVGILAYLYQAVMHVRIISASLKGARESAKERAIVVTLFMSYVGVLIMSQVNPGLFCPIPYGLLATVIFALLDGNDGSRVFAKRLKKNKSLEE